MVLVIKTTGVEDYLDGGNAFIKALIMGPPSAGKTRSASFWPKPIFADCEKGRMSIADRAVPYAEIITVADMDKLLEILEHECKKPVRDRRYQTLVIDTVDAYQRIVIQSRLDAEKKEALSGWGDWGYLDAKMTQFVAKLHKLPMNIVVNVHTKDHTEGEGDAKSVSTGVKLKGDLKDQIAAEFDLVGLMGTYWEAEDGERVLKRGIQWHPEPTKPVLKDRSGQLPKWTTVTFTSDDYDQLFTTLISHLDNLPDATTLETHETDPAISTAPVPPTKGGPVASPVTPAAAPRKAAAPKAAPAPAAAPAAAPAPAAPAAPQTPTPVTNVPAATRPTAGAVPAAPKPVPGASAAPREEDVPDPDDVPMALADAPDAAAEAATEEPMTEEAIAEAVGGQVISQTTDVDAAPTGQTPEDQAAEAAVDTQDDGSQALFCGTGFEGAEPTAEGCGTEIITDEHGGDQNAMQVEIAQLKTRTNLCNACFAAFRAANKKG